MPTRQTNFYLSEVNAFEKRSSGEEFSLTRHLLCIPNSKLAFGTVDMADPDFEKLADAISRRENKKKSRFAAVIDVCSFLKEGLNASPREIEIVGLFLTMGKPVFGNKPACQRAASHLIAKESMDLDSLDSTPQADGSYFNSPYLILTRNQFFSKKQLQNKAISPEL
ncbi:hypothetical protein TNIN_259221 [Trichonephila inaurata madagascariensis]|uniref:Uncharacterized protein n=1 Tax=Trichonephila inaurata madagascariensis TaxID=2747483 RepID=A0A8X6XSW2_9ARAC|nr:hypothetical protein TNIN_259221 [Trichonephila inaurata madagascariensis]